MLKLRRAIVVDADSTQGPEQSLVVELVGEDGRRAAIADVELLGRVQVGDELIVNVQALDLGLGSGGFDVVHVNLTRGRAGPGTEGGNVTTLVCRSLQLEVKPVEDERLILPVERGVAV